MKKSREAIDHRNNCRQERLGSTFECIGPFGGPQGKLFGAKDAPQDDKIEKASFICEIKV
jgi:hypothetical protein